MTPRANRPLFMIVLDSGGPATDRHRSNLTGCSEWYETVPDEWDGIRAAREKYAKRANKSFHFDPRRGKGSHGVLYLGNRRTVVRRGELKPGTFRNMLNQLDIPKEEF